MSLLEVFMLSAALGTDLFSVSIPIGMNGVRLRLIVWSATVFALFHIGMILTGYHAGHWLGLVVEHAETYHLNCPAVAVEGWAKVIGALVLAGLGIHMVRSNLADGHPRLAFRHPLQGLSLVAIAVSVSLDALAAGFSMGMMDVDLVQLSTVLGLVIFGVAVFGLGLGRRLGQMIGKRAELAGGLVLIALGLHIGVTAVWP